MRLGEKYFLKMQASWSYKNCPNVRIIYRRVKISNTKTLLKHVRLRNHSVIMILLNLKMPEIKRPEYFRRLHQISKNLRAIVTRTCPGSDYMTKVMSYGMHMLLAKLMERFYG